MAQYQLSQRMLEELVSATLGNDMSDLKVQLTAPGQLRITGRIFVDDSDPEEIRQMLEELLEAELSGYSVSIDGPFVSRELYPNLLPQLRTLAQYPECIYQVIRLEGGARPAFRVYVRHQDQFLGSKRNRQKKLFELFPDVRLELKPLGRELSSSELNTLPKVQAFLAPYLQSLPDIRPEHIHAYKVDSQKEALWVAHNANTPPRALERLARVIMRQTDIAVTFEKKTSRSDARAFVESALKGLSWVSGFQLGFQEKGSAFIVLVDAEQKFAPELAKLAKELYSKTGFLVEIRIDIQRDVMVSRLLETFPEDGIITGLRHIEAALYDAEVYIPFDTSASRANAWSDEVEKQWGAKIMLSEAYMRAPDIRYRHLRGADADTIARRYNRPLAFSPQALEDAESASKIDWEKELQRRLDFRGTVVLSIDPERTRDIDDALSIVRRQEGGYDVGVHIADVSAFVPQGTALDQEAMLRGFTTYLAEGEIPVIPEVLANVACSLHGGKDSLCISVFMHLDEEAVLQSYDVKRTIIHNYARLNYREAQGMLDGGEHRYGWEVRTLGALSVKMRAARKATGALDLSLEEDPEKPSHQLIEEYMLLANECVSRFIREGHPTGLCLFRTHPDVTETSYVALHDLAHHLRLKIKVRDQASMQEALEALLGTPGFDIFRYHVGRTLDKAIYHVDQLGHGALAKTDYAHFTSPIRRYTDLIIHRLIEDVLYKEERQGKVCYEREELQVIADHLNHMEIRVDAGSFESHRIGDLQFYDGTRRSFTGRILSFMKGRIAIKLDQTDLMVSVKYQDFKQDKLMPLSITDDLTKRYYYLGEEVNVRTEGVNWSNKGIEARIIA